MEHRGRGAAAIASDKTGLGVVQRTKQLGLHAVRLGFEAELLGAVTLNLHESCWIVYLDYAEYSLCPIFRILLSLVLDGFDIDDVWEIKSYL